MRRVKYTCSLCEKEQETTEWRFKKKKTTFCKDCASIGTQTGIKKPQVTGINSGRWKGGEYISTDGYRMVKCDGHFHPSGRVKYKREHILVVEEFIGRELKTARGYMGEQVHHIDGDKLNNVIDNLLLCEDTSVHKLVDCQLHELAFELVRKGLIKFDTGTTRYYIDYNNFKINEN